ncbi:hypothetical protein V9T40_009605 [Parthenolecanium corni]|uniref:Uncharacterized protein n=1 Tax=Parthenolecanium corni TaxID=536013 RepID=A0AAN9Y8C1_9HEMI
MKVNRVKLWWAKDTPTTPFNRFASVQPLKTTFNYPIFKFTCILCRFFRSEIDALRAEQCLTCANSNRLKNEQLTIQWLANSVTEIRGEVAELAQSFNSTVELQQQQTLTTDISILQNDIVSLRHDVESLRGDVTKSGANLASMAQDVEVSRQLSHNTAAITANLTDEDDDKCLAHIFPK